MNKYILAAAVMLVGCRGQPTDAFDKLFVQTTVSPAEFRAGEEIIVTVVVTNTSSEAQTIPANPCARNFVVEKLDGTFVGPSGRICDAIGIFKVLEPGERVSFRDSWIGDGYPEGTEPVSPLPAGSYRVRGLFLAPGSRNPPAGVTITN